jgi:GNAT superfamily N-acetyltransferase
MVDSDSPILIRSAVPADRDELFHLARGLSSSFDVEREAFGTSFAALLHSPDAFVAVVTDDNSLIGYLLGFVHGTFYANGKVGWIKEVFVTDGFRRHGVGRLLVDSFEQWAKSHDSKLIALATRRASPFYLGLGYEESATYFRKLP